MNYVRTLVTSTLEGTIVELIEVKRLFHSYAYLLITNLIQKTTRRAGYICKGPMPPTKDTQTHQQGEGKGHRKAAS